MKSPLENLLSRYEFKTIDESHQAFREVIQEIALLGLWRGKFFEHATIVTFEEEETIVFNDYTINVIPSYKFFLKKIDA